MNIRDRIFNLLNGVSPRQTERYLRLTREGLWIVFGQSVAVAGGLFGVRLLTELMEPSTYGELALGMTVAALINQVIFGPLSNGATRFFAPACEVGELSNYFVALRRMVLSANVLTMLFGLLIVTSLVIVNQSAWVCLTSSAFIFALLSGHNSILNGIQNAARQRSIVALHQGIEPWARFLFAAGLMILFQATSTVAMIGYVIAVAAVLISQYLFFLKIVPKKDTKVEYRKDWIEELWKYSWPFASWGIFTWAQKVSDRWALGLFMSTQDVGLYAVLFQLGYYPISIVTGMVMQFLAPVFYQRAGDGSDNRRNLHVNKLSLRFTGLALGGTSVVCLLTFIFHSQVFRIFAAKEYASVSYLLPWMLLSGGLFVAAQTIALNLMSQMKTHTMVFAKIATALIGIMLNFLGAYWYGVMGVVIASVIFSTMYFLWMIILLKSAKVYTEKAIK